MIDTIRYEQERKFIEPDRTHYGLLTLDRKASLRISCKGDRVYAVEVSLPKLLYGTNSNLIHTQRDLDAAFAKVEKILSKYTAAVSQKKVFKRVDLAWHFPVIPPRVPADFFFAHQHCNHPEARTVVSIYRNHHRTTGIQWKGHRLNILMYDKTAKKIKLPRQVVRVEVQIRGRRLRWKLAAGKQVEHLDIAACYQSYRATLRKFKPKPVIRFGTKDEALFFAEKNDVRVFEMLVSRMQPVTIRRFREKFNSYLFQTFKVDWDKLLPAKKLPIKYDAGKLKSPYRFTFKKQNPRKKQPVNNY